MSNSASSSFFFLLPPFDNFILLQRLAGPFRLAGKADGTRFAVDLFRTNLKSTKRLEETGRKEIDQLGRIEEATSSNIEQMALPSTKEREREGRIDLHFGQMKGLSRIVRQ